MKSRAGEHDVEREIIAVLEASVPRRWLAIVTLVLMAGLLLYAAFSPETTNAVKIGSASLGLLALGTASGLYKATLNRVELTEEGLRDSSGVSIARIDEIAALDRGFLAFKPSNGFVLRTHAPVGRAWRPGLWWRFGHRIGVGGVAPGQQARFMADRLSELMASHG
jgi:hypothetical protein